MEEIHREKLRIWKNLGFLSLSYTCLFTAIDLVFNLQVSRHSFTNLDEVLNKVPCIQP